MPTRIHITPAQTQFLRDRVAYLFEFKPVFELKVKIEDTLYEEMELTKDVDMDDVRARMHAFVDNAIFNQDATLLSDPASFHESLFNHVVYHYLKEERQSADARRTMDLHLNLKLYHKYPAHLRKTERRLENTRLDAQPNRDININPF